MFDTKNIKGVYIVTLRKVRNFFLGSRGKEFLIFLFFLFVSFGFWLLQVMNEVYHTDLTVKVRLKDIPKEVVLTEDLPDEIDIRVEDRGTVLVNYMLGRTFFPLSFSFTNYDVNGSYGMIGPDDIKRKISTQLNSTTKFLGFSPDTLCFAYSRGSAKKVPVILNGTIQPERLYNISATGFSPDSVTVYAPDNVLKSVTAVYTEPVDLKNVADTVSAKVGLKKIKGAKLVPSHSILTVYSDMYSEKTIEVPIVGVGFPEGEVLRTFPSKVNVTFLVTFRKFKGIMPEDFRIEVSYNEVVKNETGKIDLKISKQPEDVNHIRLNPSSVEFLIEQKLNLTENEAL